MKKLSPSEIGLMESLLNFSQRELHAALTKVIKKNYEKVTNTKDFLIGWGDIPVALVAHMDTVFREDERVSLYYDQRKGVLWKPYGAGFDDRAGVYAILKIIQAGYRPTVIFTTDEEVGAQGAMSLVTMISQPKTPIKYMIELDRQGIYDCVFYSCGNDDFISYVESFGFCEQWGTFSDISIICPEWRIAGVNLSIGYFDEHTQSERLEVAPLLATIEKVKAMLEVADNAPYFNYIYRRCDFKDYYWRKYGISIEDNIGEEVICAKCGTVINEWESIPVITEDGGKKFYCGECLPTGNVDFCIECGEAFENNNDELLCPICRRKGKTV